jgi:trimethylamine--corrinoid protein Co-methyltransferase
MPESYAFKLLPDEALERIHHESLSILETLGVRIPNKQILNIFKKNGAVVDFDTQVVRLPRKLVEQVIRQAVSSQERYYREHEDPNGTYRIKGLMGLSKTPYLFDHEDFKRRKSTLADVLKAIAIGNRLEHVERISCLVSPEIYQGDYFDLLCFYLLYLYSGKRHFLGKINSVESARGIIEMARTVAESDEQLKDGKLLEYELLPVRNLEYDPKRLAIALELLKNKIRILAGHWCWMGCHTPMSYASALMLSNANVLASMSIVILVNPDQLYLDYITDIFTINREDPASPLFGSPNQAVFAMAAKQLADRYGFRVCLANSGLTDAIPDNFQSGFERGVTAAMTVACGARCIGLQGILGRDQGVSFEELVIDHELLSYLNFLFSRDFRVNDETLQVDKIRNAGIGASFAELTRRREETKDCYWKSDIFLSGTYETWDKGRMLGNIKSKLSRILKESFPPTPAVGEAKASGLDEILRRCVKDEKLLSAFRTELSRITTS